MVVGFITISGALIGIEDGNGIYTMGGDCICKISRNRRGESKGIEGAAELGDCVKPKEIQPNE